MKRNMELIRELAIRIESKTDSFHVSDISIDGYTPRDLLYHCVLMAEAGLISAEIVKVDGGEGDAFISRLTWQGHDFVDAARDQSIWNKTLKTVRDKTTSVAFDSFLEILKAATKAVVGNAMTIGI